MWEAGKLENDPDAYIFRSDFPDFHIWFSMKTIFQRIIDREIPGRFEYEDEHCVVIHDIVPQAPVHLLIIPKRVIVRTAATVPADAPLLGHLLVVAGQVAKKLNLGTGFRLVINNGPDAGETAPHLHVHLLAGRQLTWPPG
jgi:histidine triad (HIT) family protein